MDLFSDGTFFTERSQKPLADRVRPKSLDDVVGQEHLLGEGKLLRVLLEGNDVPSLIFWGPSGVGKTTIGWLIGRVMNLPYVSLSAVSIGIKEVKGVIQKAKNQRIILFVDEFHRFNKLQQDTFLPHVENGTIILIGATTENPSFEIISPLLSRMRVLTLKSLDKADLIKIIRRALKDDEELKGASITIDTRVIEEIAYLADGDARRALNLLEVCYKMVKEGPMDAENVGLVIDHEAVQEAYQKKTARYDKTGEMHYNLISALHKSMRGSDADATLYWLTRMIEGGEDPLYILRRMVRFASEDVGNADPYALTITMSATEAFRFLGPPEGYLALAQAAVYLSLCEKSNAVYTAFNAAMRDTRDLPEFAVPMHIRNAPTKLMNELGYGEGYLYPHDHPGGLVKQTYLPEELLEKRYYCPTGRGEEKRLKAFMEKVRAHHQQ